MLYDLHIDPQELHDLGNDSAHTDVVARMREALLEWSLTDHNRITTPDEKIEGYSAATQLKNGIIIGYWDEAEIEHARRSYNL